MSAKPARAVGPAAAPDPGVAPSPLRASDLGACLSDKPRCKVHRFGERRVAKLFRRGIPRQAVEHELRVMLALHRIGAPMPAVDGALWRTADGCFGIVTDYIEGEALSVVAHGVRQRMFLVRTMQALQARIAGLEPSIELPSQREWLKARLLAPSALSLRERQRMLATLDGLPDERTICHGSLDPANILVAADGNAYAFGWSTAGLGAPMADIARSAVIVAAPNGRGGRLKQWAISVRARTRASAYAEAVLGARTRGNDWRAWLAVQAAARLSEQVGPHQRRRLLALFKRVAPRADLARSRPGSMEA